MCALAIGNFAHAFVKIDVTQQVEFGASLNISSYEHHHGHSHFDDNESGDISETTQKHNPLDHSHDLPFVLAFSSNTDARFVITRVKVSKDILFHRLPNSLDRPPRNSFLI